ncbi:MAG TPA: hypothetical protein VF148_10170 [Acidimicrobiia bacterium]
MGALRDCEAVVHGVLGQPVNSITTLAFVVAGLIIIRRTNHIWIGIASIATGLGSFLFHGPMPPFGEWIHDATLAWLLLVVAAHGRTWQRWAGLPGLLAVSAVTIIPGTSDPVGAALAGLAVVGVVISDRSISTLGPLALLAAVAIVGRLGATDGPLCHPDSIWQPHGLWHIGAAVAITWWAVARSSATR